MRTLAVPSGPITALLFGIMALLLLAHAGLQLFVQASGHDHVYGVVPLFDLDHEANVPTFFAASVLLLAAGLAAFAARMQVGDAASRGRDWALFSLVLAWLALDEAAGIHELLIRPMRELLGGAAEGALHFTWVVPGVLIVLLLVVAFRDFARRLGPQRRGLLLAATLYFGGAIGVELLAGRHVASHGADTLLYRIGLVGLEEGLEMAGAIVLVRVLLEHLARRCSEVRLRFVQGAVVWRRHRPRVEVPARTRWAGTGKTAPLGGNR